jgi:UDP-N-acetyl-D-galactosamine dehydrogenase
LAAHSRKISIIGLGYVGLPAAVAFARSGTPVIGFDIDRSRVAELRSGADRTREVEPRELKLPSLKFTSDVADLAEADFHIVTVPTPVDAARRPDLGAMLAASRAVGGVLKPGHIVVYESTVYPGAVEEDCIPVLEQASKLKAGIDFTVGYSPERINPGDKTHRFETITKVVSAQDSATLDIVAAVYGSVVTAGIHRAPSIKVAEAAKVIENTQRDLNIAFMNELSAIFHQLGIDTGDVLAAAATKWNFLNYQPGLVGGHCIGVDPYYLTYRAEKAGYNPAIILAGRRINDGVGARVAQECVRSLTLRNCTNSVVTILGMTFKEDVPDIRNSKVIDIVHELSRFGIKAQVHDPLASMEETRHEYGVGLTAMKDLAPADAVILAVAHGDYIKEGWPLMTRLLKSGKGTVLDVKSKLDRARKPDEVELWRL